MSCEKIDPRDFHGPAASQYTLNCLEDLAKSPKFKSYVRHIEYKERLYLTWFIAPFTLFAILYYHVAMFGEDGINLFAEPSARSKLPLAVAPSGMIAVTAVLLLYVFPCIVIAPFVGFFEEPNRWTTLAVFFFLTAVNVACVALGGARLNYPPFVTTSPTIVEVGAQGSPQDVALVFVRDILVRRALCLEGFIFAGYAVSLWQRSFWARAWHPPFPLLTIPVMVGLVGVGWWLVVQKAIPLFLELDGTPTSVADALRWSSVQADPAGAVSLCGTVAKEVGRRLWLDAKPIWEQRQLSAVLSDTSSCTSLYLAAASVALMHLLFLFAKPIFDFVVSAFFYALPIDPTIWGLTLLMCVGTSVALWRAAESSEYTVYLAALGALVAALLFNGFVA